MSQWPYQNYFTRSIIETRSKHGEVYLVGIQPTEVAAWDALEKAAGISQTVRTNWLAGGESVWHIAP